MDIYTWYKSPNYGYDYQGQAGRPGGISHLVIHATVGDLQSTLNWFLTDSSDVSSHYVVSKEGYIYQLVDELNVAWHARSYNNYSIGIELVNKNDGKDPYPPVQIETLLWLSRQIIRRWGIPRNNVVRHVDIDPKRKSDPRGFPFDDFLDKLYNPWDMWGNMYPLPVDQRGWGIPQMWLKHRYELGACVSYPLYAGDNSGNCVQMFKGGVIIYSDNKSEYVLYSNLRPLTTKRII